MVANKESAVLARELAESAYRQQKIIPDHLTIHSDRGAAMTPPFPSPSLRP